MKNARRFLLKLTYTVDEKVVIRTVLCENEEEAEAKWIENMVGQTRIFDAALTMGVLREKSMIPPGKRKKKRTLMEKVS